MLLCRKDFIMHISYQNEVFDYNVFGTTSIPTMIPFLRFVRFLLILKRKIAIHILVTVCYDILLDDSINKFISIEINMTRFN